MTAAQAPEGQYVASLTGLRGIAAFAVFLFHFGALNPGIRLDMQVPMIGSALQFPLGFGFAGVDIFFVLSGFLLTLPFAQSALAGEARPSLRQYFKRRFLRVFPAYYAQLFIILMAGSWFITWKPQTVATFAAHLVMFFNIRLYPVEPMVGVWWTLPVEMGFYLLLPFLQPLLRPSRWVPTLLTGVLVSMLYRNWVALHFGSAAGAGAFLLPSLLPGSLTEFLLGASAAIIAQYFAVSQKPRPAPWALDLMFVLGIALSVLWLDQVVLAAAEEYWLGHWSMIIAPLALGLPLATISLALYWGSRLGAFLLSNRVVYFLGVISYSLYLWHFVVMLQLQFLIGESYSSMSNWFKFPLATVAVILTASISYYAIEKPFYKLKATRQALIS